MATRTTLQPDQGPNFTKITRGDLVATSDGIQLVWNKLLTDAYAYARTEHPNVFHKNQDIQKVIPELRFLQSGDTMFGRLLMAVTKSFYMTLNGDFDGGNWNCEDVGQPLWGINVNCNSDRFSVFRGPAGANPRTGALVERFGVDAAGALFERGRIVAAGAWANFVPTITSNGTGTVTVTTTNSAKSTLVGKSMTCILNVVYTMAGAGAGDTVLSFGIPGGFTTNAIDVGYARILDAGVGTDAIGVSFVVGTARINVAKVPGAAFANGAGSTLQLNITFEIV